MPGLVPGLIINHNFMFTIGDKTFGVHCGMLFQEYFIDAFQKVRGFNEVHLMAFIVYYGNENYAVINDQQPAFASIGEVYKLLEDNPGHPAYGEILKVYEKSQLAKTVQNANKDTTKKKSPAAQK